MIKAVLILLFTLQLLPAKPLEQSMRVIMGTYITIKAPTREMIAEGFKVLEEVDRTFTTYPREGFPPSPIIQLNTHKQIKRTPMIDDLITRSFEVGQETRGYFDITSGTITKLLYRFGETPLLRVPSDKTLAEAAKEVDFYRIIIGKDTIQIPESTQLDFGGIGKGYGVDLAAKRLRAMGAKRGIIAASGDIRCLNTCKVSIRHPFEKGNTLFNLRTKHQDMSISTSGVYERYAKDQAHNHIIDPFTGKSAQEFVSLTLISQSNNTRIDAFATALCAMPSSEEAFTWLILRPKIAWIAVMSDGTIKRSPNLDSFVEILEP